MFSIAYPLKYSPSHTIFMKKRKWERKTVVMVSIIAILSFLFIQSIGENIEDYKKSSSEILELNLKISDLENNIRDNDVELRNLEYQKDEEIFEIERSLKTCTTNLVSCQTK